MVSIIPAERSSWDVIGKAIGKNLSQNLPGAVQRGYERQMGLNAVDQLQNELAASGGDINKMLPAIARAYTLNPNLERSGIAEHALRQARVGAAYGQPQQGFGQPSQIPGQTGMQTDMQPSIQEGQQTPSQQPKFATPSPFNVMTVPDIDAESKRYAQAVGDPNAYNTRFNQLTAQNDAATAQRQALEDAALKANVSPADLPRFMVVNSHLDPRNPSEWAQEGVRNFSRVKSNDNKIQNAFIPGLGSGLLGRDREKTLKGLIPTLKENKELGLEQEDRKYLADQYLTQTEIESLYHPLTPKHEKAINELPKGIFPAETGKELDFFAPQKENPFVSYEEAIERAPKEMKIMQDRLSDFFLKNVDNDTSLLALREKLWEDKDYDWRQIGPAVREAQKKGLKLNPEQQREATTIDTQPPIQSLPDLFQDLSRIPAFLRGNK